MAAVPPSSSLKFAQVQGSGRYVLLDKVVHGGELLEMCTSGGWLTGRYECDAGTGDVPTLFFSVELDGGGVTQLHLPIPEGALLRRR